jgi:hypothetical protein
MAEKLTICPELTERETALLLGLVTSQADEVEQFATSMGRRLGGSRQIIWRRISDELCRAIIQARSERYGP